MTFYERSELFRKYPKTPVFDHSNYRLFERIPAVPGTSKNRGLTVGLKYCRILQGEHSAILLTFIKLPIGIKIFVLSIFKWPFYTGFTVHVILADAILHCFATGTDQFHFRYLKLRCLFGIIGRE